MCPPKPSNDIPPSQVQHEQAQPQQNPAPQNPPQQNLAAQNSFQMNAGQGQRPKTELEILLQFEEQKGISVNQKRQHIKEMLEYEKERPKILKKKIAKEKALEGRIHCLKAGCQQSFPRITPMRMHVARDHKKLADSLGIFLYECILCKQYSSLKQSALDKHQISCAQQKRAILVAQGELSEEDVLNTEEELLFKRSLKFN